MQWAILQNGKAVPGGLIGAHRYRGRFQGRLSGNRIDGRGGDGIDTPGAGVMATPVHWNKCGAPLLPFRNDSAGRDIAVFAGNFDQGRGVDAEACGVLRMNFAIGLCDMAGEPWV